MEKRSIKAEFEQEKDKKRISSTKRTELFQIKNIQHYDRKVCISPVQKETAATQRRNTVTTKRKLRIGLIDDYFWALSQCRCLTDVKPAWSKETFLEL
jgi:hypothetical protein